MECLAMFPKGAKTREIQAFLGVGKYTTQQAVRALRIQGRIVPFINADKDAVWGTPALVAVLTEERARVRLERLAVRREKDNERRKKSRERVKAARAARATDGTKSVAKMKPKQRKPKIARNEPAVVDAVKPARIVVEDEWPVIRRVVQAEGLPRPYTQAPSSVFDWRPAA